MAGKIGSGKGVQAALPGALCAEIIAHGAQGIFFQSGDLGLGDADGFGYFHLGFSLEEAQGDDFVFSGIETFHGLAEGEMFHPGLFLIFFVAYRSEEYTS